MHERIYTLYGTQPIEVRTPKRIRKTVLNEVSAIFEALDKKEASQRSQDFISKCHRQLPEAGGIVAIYGLPKKTLEKDLHINRS